ncbi:MAG: hypothetical protein ACYC4N_26795 [Pirellulaceae bacterium]
MAPKRYDPFDPGIYLDFLGTEDCPRFIIGNWKMRLWWSGNEWITDRSKAKLFSDFAEARDEAWGLRPNYLWISPHELPKPHEIHMRVMRFRRD